MTGTTQHQSWQSTHPHQITLDPYLKRLKLIKERNNPSNAAFHATNVCMDLDKLTSMFCSHHNELYLTTVHGGKKSFAQNVNFLYLPDTVPSKEYSFFSCL
jgi:hypothetical protein